MYCRFSWTISIVQAWSATKNMIISVVHTPPMPPPWMDYGNYPMHCPLWAFKSFFQFCSQRAIFHSKRPNPHLPLCSGAPGCPKLMCELVTFEKNLVGASKKFRFYTIKCSKYQRNLGRKCQF